MPSSESNSEVVLELAEEFLERFRKGQRPSLKEYTDRHPHLAAEIKEVFPAMAMMENIALADESLAGSCPGNGGFQAPKALERLGDYRIIREVGRGGMGVVYEAEQVSLGRHVALKVLPNKAHADDRQKRRFEREAKAAAKLHHTNIVPVFGVGEQDGLPFYVMQFIQGLGMNDVLEELRHLQGHTAHAPTGELPVSRRNQAVAEVAKSLLTGHVSLDASAGDDGPDSPADGTMTFHQPAGVPNLAPPRHAKDHPPSSGSFSGSSVVLPGQSDDGHRQGKRTYWQSIANIGYQVANALDYAHQQGILHRDIKPSNLLLDTRGTVWVTDFGLAKTEDQQNLTTTGDILGTLRYMPPEAFEGRTDRRSDVYALGLTLYELLALKPAYGEKDRHKLIKQVTTSEVPRLDVVNPAIPRDLVTVIHKAIDRDPAHRYPNAGELAADLRRYLDDEPIHARRLSVVERCGRWCRRNPLVASLTAAIVVVTAVGFATTLVQLEKAVVNEERAMQSAAEAEKQREEANRQANIAGQERDRATAAYGRQLKTEVGLKAAIYGNDLTLLQSSWDGGNVSRAVQLLEQLKPAAGELDLRGWEWDHFNRLCNDDVRTVALDDRPVGQFNAAFCDAGTRLFSYSSIISYDGKRETNVTVFDTATGRTLKVLNMNSLISESMVGGPFRGGFGGVTGLAALRVSVNGDGTRMAVLGGGSIGKGGKGAGGFPGGFLGSAANMTASSFQARSISALGFMGSSWPLGPYAAASALLAPTAQQLANQQAAFKEIEPVPVELKVLEVNTGKEMFAKKLAAVTRTTFERVVLSPDGSRIAWRLGVPLVQICTVGQDANPIQLGSKSPKNGRMELAFSPDGKRLAVYSLVDKSVVFWETATGKRLNAISAPDLVSEIKFSPDGQKIALVCNVGAKGLKDGAFSLAITVQVRILDANSGEERRITSLAPIGTGSASGSVHHVRFSRDGELLAGFAMGQDDSPRVGIWDVATGVQTRTLRGNVSGLLDVVPAAAGNHFLAASLDGLIKEWDASGADELRPGTLKGLERITAGKTKKTKGKGGQGSPLDFIDEIPFGGGGFGGGGFGPGGGQMSRRITFPGSPVVTVDDNCTQIAVWKKASTSTTKLSGFKLDQDLGDLTVMTVGALGSAMGPLAAASTLLSGMSYTSLAGGVGGPFGAAMTNEVGVWDFKGRDPVFFTGHGGGIVELVLSPNGKLAASVAFVKGSGQATDEPDLELRIWETSNGHTRHVIPLPATYETLRPKVGKAGGGAAKVNQIFNQIQEIKYLTSGFSPPAFSTDGKRVAYAVYRVRNSGTDPRCDVKVFDTDTGKMLWGATLDTKSNISTVSFSSDGQVLVGWSPTGIAAWNAATGDVRWTMASPDYSPRYVALSDDGKRLVATISMLSPFKKAAARTTFEYDNKTCVLDAASGRVLFTVGHNSRYGNWLPTLSRDGKWLAVVKDLSDKSVAEPCVEVWDVDRGEVKCALKGYRDIVDMVFTADGRRLATADGRARSEVKIWDLTNGRELIGFKADRQSNGLQFTPDGHRLVMHGFGTTEPVLPKVWDATPVLRGRQ